jgi:hypothetical protein
MSYISLASVKDILVQPNIDGKRSKWIAKILEFDLEIRPTRLIKSQVMQENLSTSTNQLASHVSEFKSRVEERRNLI